MSHDHHHQDERRLGLAFVLIAIFTVVEAVGGWMANSLALLADAGHMFLDASALGLSWYAMRLSRRDHDHSLSYGYHRFQVLAAFVNALTLLVVCAWISFEALTRLQEPEPILPGPALIIAAIGLIVNLIAFRLLHQGRGRSLNIRSAYLHVLGDILGSVAAIAAMAIVLLTGWLPADPLLSMVVVLILLRGAWRLLRDSGHILLEGVPGHLDLNEIKQALTRGVAEVLDVHHVHAWALTSERPLVTLHAAITDGSDTQRVVAAVKAVLLEEFGVDHSTVQVELGPCPDD
jgi:cobalt-zinc-cadmium efflux system protein